MKEIFNQLDKIGSRTEAALDGFLDDEEMYLKYVRNFPEEPSMELIIKAMDEKDYVKAEKAAHALKGIVKNLYFNPLATALTKMDTALKEENIAVALQNYEEVKKQYRIFCDVILVWRSKTNETE